MEDRFIAYFRVSTDKQGRSGHGLEAQRQAASSHLNGGGGYAGRVCGSRVREA